MVNYYKKIRCEKGEAWALYRKDKYLKNKFY